MSNQTYIETLIRICDDIGITYRTDYSGRAMYGRKCFAIEADRNALGDAFKLAAAIVEAVEPDYTFNLEMAQELLNEMTDVRTDSMGRGSIIYWPDIDTTDLELDQPEFDE